MQKDWITWKSDEGGVLRWGAVDRASECAWRCRGESARGSLSNCQGADCMRRTSVLPRDEDALPAVCDSPPGRWLLGEDQHRGCWLVCCWTCAVCHHLPLMQSVSTFTFIFHGWATRAEAHVLVPVRSLLVQMVPLGLGSSVLWEGVCFSK